MSMISKRLESALCAGTGGLGDSSSNSGLEGVKFQRRTLISFFAPVPSVFRVGPQTNPSVAACSQDPTAPRSRKPPLRPYVKCAYLASPNEVDGPRGTSNRRRPRGFFDAWTSPIGDGEGSFC